VFNKYFPEGFKFKRRGFKFKSQHGT